MKLDTHRISSLILIVGVMILGFDAYTHYRLQLSQNSVKIEVSAPADQVVPDVDVSTQRQPASTSKPDFSSLITDFEFVSVANASRIEAAQVSFLQASTSAQVSQINIYHLKYEIKDSQGNWKPVSAKVYVPTSKDLYPLYVFGSGTTGIADKCAPSLEDMNRENIGNYENHMITQAAAGYVAVFPDYEGFNHLETTQAYFVSESEAKTLLGAIRSLLELKVTEPALEVIDFNNVFVGGYSQGGHAALSAAQHWDELPSSVRLKGVLQFAGAADVEALFLESPWLASYLVASYVEYYQPQLLASQVLHDKWLQEMAKNNANLCVNQAYRYYPKKADEIYTPGFLDAITTHSWSVSLEEWHEIIKLNTPLSSLPDVPYLSIQGEVDPIVTAKAQLQNVEVLCEQNMNVQYKEIAGINHFQIRQAGFHLSDRWMKDIMNGKPTLNNCK